jgi:hypothetical protein
VNNKLRPALAAIALFSLGSSSAAAADESRQTQVEHKSTQVMPFDMNASMHEFKPMPNGGIQTVFIHDGDPHQVALVRWHLRKEAAAFTRGDYTDPASIHGGSMPGLREMRAGAKRITVRYAEIPNGATITYATTDAVLIAAIHSWFNAQVRDHGPHATMKM